MTTHNLRILAQPLCAAARALVHRLSPGQALAVAVFGLAGVAAFGITPGTTLDSVATHAVNRVLAVPVVAGGEAAVDRYWHEERVRRGDTIGSLLARASVDDADAMQFLRTDPQARALYRLRPGGALQLATDDDGRMLALRFLAGNGEMLSIARGSNGFSARSDPPDTELRVTLRSGEIETTLFRAADDAGLPEAITLGLADVFDGAIDFYHDLRHGDRFAVLYETRYVDGEPAGTGRILAAEFDSQGAAHRAFLWRGPDGGESYYTERGLSTRNAFLRSPVQFSRITSGFTLARFHPFLHQWLAHKGTDFAAPTGTPVRATADGIVTFKGQQTGYGNVVMLKNGGPYSTVFAHLSKFADGLHDGERVHQGDMIGYVGQTGWATGPHLHYELRIAGVPHDPLTVALPTASPLTPDEREAFLAQVAPLADELAVVHTLPDTRIVAAD